MKTNCSLLTFLTCLLFPYFGTSQPATDSVFYTKTINNLKATYFTTIKENAHLYNGIQYEYYGPKTIGSPFFMIDSMHNGSVFYDGFLYEDVPLRYDLVNDVLLIKYWGINNTLQL